MHDPLRETLLRGDPADGDQLSQPERQRMWQRILAVAVNPRPARVRWPVTVAAVAASSSAVALVVLAPLAFSSEGSGHRRRIALNDRTDATPDQEQRRTSPATAIHADAPRDEDHLVESTRTYQSDRERTKQ